MRRFGIKAVFVKSHEGIYAMSLLAFMMVAMASQALAECQPALLKDGIGAENHVENLSVAPLVKMAENTSSKSAPRKEMLFNTIPVTPTYPGDDRANNGYTVSTPKQEKLPYHTDSQGESLSLQEEQENPQALLILGSSELEGEVRFIKPLVAPLGNFLRGQVTLQNLTDATFLLDYKFDWLDDSGFLIGNGGVWQPVVLRPRQLMPIKSVGKSTDAAKMQVTIRITN